MGPAVDIRDSSGSFVFGGYAVSLECPSARLPVRSSKFELRKAKSPSGAGFRLIRILSEDS